MHITIKEARMLIDAGAFSGIHLVRGLDAGKWEIVFEKKFCDNSCQLKTERGHVRSFPTVESALRVLEQLGVRPSSLKFDV